MSHNAKKEEAMQIVSKSRSHNVDRRSFIGKGAAMAAGVFILRLSSRLGRHKAQLYARCRITPAV